MVVTTRAVRRAKLQSNVTTNRPNDIPVAQSTVSKRKNGQKTVAIQSSEILHSKNLQITKRSKYKMTANAHLTYGYSSHSAVWPERERERATNS